MTSYTLATHEQRAKRQEYLEDKKAEEAKVTRQKEEQINFLESCLDRFNLNYDAKNLIKDEIEKFNKKTQIENQKESERWEKEQIDREERRKENIKETLNNKQKLFHDSGYRQRKRIADYMNHLQYLGPMSQKTNYR